MLRASHLNAGKVRWVVVVEWVGGDATVELLDVVVPLRAQVVDEVVVLVLLLQEALDLEEGKGTKTQ